MSWADGHLLGFDLETLGLDVTTTLPVSFALVNVEGGIVTNRRYGLINPGVPIPEEAQAIHGISDAEVQERGGSLENSVIGITETLLKASREHTPVVGANLRFDLSIVDSCYRRITEVGLREAGWDGPVIDVMTIDRAVDKYRKGSRKLSNLCEHYGVNLAEAHHAGADAEAAVMVALALAKRYPTEIGNVDLDVLHVQQTAWRRAWAKDFSEYRVRKGEPPLDESEGDWPLLGDKVVSV